MAVAEKIREPEELFLQYRECPTQSLRNELVLQYSYIAKTVAKQMRGYTTNFAQVEDMVNEGIITLIDCIEKFDVTKGVKFESYAFMRVKNANIDYIRKQDWLPRRVRKTAKDVSSAFEQLSNKLMREPTVKELADFMEVTENSLRAHYSELSSSVMISFETLLQGTVQDVGTFDLSDKEETRPEECIFRQELKEQLILAIDALTEKERLVVSLYYYEHLRLAEIAEIMGVSESRVCQLNHKAVDKMKAQLDLYMKG